jgi:hypothetical protein
MCNSSYKYRNIDIVISTVLTYSWLHFDDKLLVTKHACRLPVCAVGTFLHRTHQCAAQGFDRSGSKMSILDVCLHMATYTLRTITCQ